MTKHILLIIFTLSITSCFYQKLMQTVADAKKIEANKQKFINRPLKELLNQVQPPIKVILGSPQDADDYRLGSISFFFTTKEEIQKREARGEKPTVRLSLIKSRNIVNIYYPSVKRLLK